MHLPSRLSKNALAEKHSQWCTCQANIPIKRLSSSFLTEVLGKYGSQTYTCQIGFLPSCSSSTRHMTSFANQKTRSISNDNSSLRNQPHSKVARNLTRTCQKLSRTITPAADRLEPRGAAVLLPGGLQSNSTSGLTKPVKNHSKVAIFTPSGSIT